MGQAGSAFRTDGSSFSITDNHVSIVAEGETACSLPYPQCTALDMENAVGGRVANTIFNTTCCGMSAGNVRAIILEETQWIFSGRWNT